MASSSSAAAAASASFKYNVFLSFRGQDTRYNFTDHLCKALRAKGIETFMDDQLTRGELITPALVTAIEGSRHSVIVLSENYASSKWCLDELVKILQTQNTKGRRAVPIFYNVNPSDVGNQRGSFGTALADHEEKLKADHEKKLKYDMERVEGWRKALTQVGKISGFTYSRDRPETQFIEEIIVDISKDLNFESSNDTKNLVGMDFCITKLKSQLFLESAKVRIVGIWGMGGIGKTTLARVIFEQLFRQFEGYCFLEDLKRKSKDDLKVGLLSKVLRDENINMGPTSIRARLHSKKVLIVIDDVTHPDMLETLVGERDWFGPQSRIIITTRDKHLLREVDEIYEVQKLDDYNAMKLFISYAFKNKPRSGDVIVEHLYHIISYAQGLPLALKVLGRSLYDRNEDYCRDKLNQLKKIPDGEIQEVLQISFDGLEDYEKEIFLDIACFFRGSDKTFVSKILGSCNFFVGIENLIFKSLITITNEDRLEMHDLLQEMGRQIVRKTSPKEPGSRLWEQKDISHILKWKKGTKKVEGIFLDLSGLDQEMNFTTKAFSKMTNLRLLKIYQSNLWGTGGQMQCKLHISDDFKFHYDELRYLHWDEYPCESLPFDFEAKNLAHFCMPHSHLTQLWEGQKVFENLKFVDVSYSKNLKVTPDFSRARNLEELVLKECTSLLEIHPSLGSLSKLILLNLKNCIGLEHLPSIRQLVSLQTLILSGCSKLKKLPEFPQHMPYLSKLYLDGTAVTDLSGWSELGNFQENSGSFDSLGELNSDDSTIRQPPSSSIVLRNPNASLLSEPRRSYFISTPYSSLKYLNLSGTPIIHLPWNMERLSMLQRLDLSDCTRLQALPVLPSSLKRLDAGNCTSLELISPLPVFNHDGGFLFGNCIKLAKYQSKIKHEIQSVASHLDRGGWRSIYDYDHPFFQIPFSTVFPGSEIPDWFRHHSQGREITIKVPRNWHTNSNLLGFAFSVVMSPLDASSGWNMYCDLNGRYCDLPHYFPMCSFFSAWSSTDPFRTPMVSDHVWLAYVPSFCGSNFRKWRHIKFSFCPTGFYVVQSCGVYPVFIEGTSDERDYFDDKEYSDDKDFWDSYVDDKDFLDSYVVDEGFWDFVDGGDYSDDPGNSASQNAIVTSSHQEGQPRGIGLLDTNTEAGDQEMHPAKHSRSSQSGDQEMLPAKRSRIYDQ